MKWLDVIKLHAGDEVAHKGSGAKVKVVEVDVFPHEVNRFGFANILCDDGHWYMHKDLV